MGHTDITVKTCFAMLWSLLITVGVICQSFAAPPPLHMARITPSGTDVPTGRQIVFQFDRPVVPMGRMARKASEIPIVITPSLKCQWRWLNSKALACQLDEKSALKPATRYTIMVNPGIKALDGATLEKPLRSSFTTIRPKIRDVWFKTWRAPGMPVIRLTFNQPVFRDSVGQHIFFTAHDKTEKLTGVTVSPDPDIKEKPHKIASTDSHGEARRFWLVSPPKELPPDSKVALQVKPGVISLEGPEKGVEKRILAAFSTFPPFAFEGIECTDNSGKTIHISPNDPHPFEKRCNPLRQTALVFSSPVISEEIKENVTFTPDLAGGRTDYDPWANRSGHSNLSYPHKKGQTYRVWIPELLKAFQEYRIRSDKNTPRDEFGRPLKVPIRMRFETDHRLPNFVLTHRQAVLEKGVDSEVPLVVTNLNEVDITYDRLTVHGKKSQLSRKIQIPKVRDIAFKIPLETRHMLDHSSGVLRGTVQTRPQIKKSPRERWFMVQVTPFQAHVKIGHYNTLVWVTDLATGEPVEGARVSLYRDTYMALSQTPTRLTHGTTDDNGIVMLAGTKTIDPLLTTLESYGLKKPHLFARIQKENDMAILPLDGPFRVDLYQASGNTLWPDMRKRYGHMHAWGTTAQGVYRAGDTVQYKLYVRNQDNETFIPPPRSGYDLKVMDPMGKKVTEVKDLTLNEFGAASGQFQVPKTGAVGWYRFELSASFAKWVREPMRVLVSDFTPSPFKVTTDLNGRFFETGNRVDIVTHARLHAGGPYGDAHNRVTAILKSRPLILKQQAFQNIRFDTILPKAPPEQTVFQKENRLNNQGDADSGFSLVEGKILYGQLMVESTVRDDRGKSIAGRTHADYAARDRYVGLRKLTWVMEEDQPGSVELLAVDGRGEPVKGVPISITLSRRETKAARVKGAGNAYVTHYTHQWVDVDQKEIVSHFEPVPCSLTPQNPGSHRISAVIKDTQGRSHETRIYQWVTGKGEVVWDERPDNRLEIIPEKNRYEIGDRARYLVKNPFPGAKALVTIERYGVLRHWVQTLPGSTPMIEFDVKQDETPGFYLSVVVISPRVEKPPLQTGQVDLGKPGFRMGYVKTTVSDPRKELVVHVRPEQETYKPKDRVTVKLTATIAEKTDPEPVELAVVVLDDAVFDLIKSGSDYFDPYKGFYTLDGLDLDNFSLLMGLVGRQKFEKKGADTGGGGGAGISLRSVFKFVSYWNPSIKTDEQGEAVITFEAPDNLTGWRVLAMAVTPEDRMGLGQGKFKVNQPTEIRPVMPNQVTAGDKFQAGFSIMNRTPKERRLTVAVTARGPIQTPSEQPGVEMTFDISLSPFKRHTVWLPIETNKAGRIGFTAKAWDKSDGDGVTHTLMVHKRYFLETAAQYGSTTKQSVSETIGFPKEMRTDVGGITIHVSPTVLGNLEGAFLYLKDYPYTCWEQILTKGVMAGHYAPLKGYLPSHFKWPESKKLPIETLHRASDFQAPNGGMTYYIPKNRYVSPYLSAYTALAFTWLREAGYKIPVTVKEKLHAYLLTLLRRNTVPDFYSMGMSSTVRAVALAALAKEGQISGSDLSRYAPHMKEMSLFGKAHFLMAALSIPQTEKMRAHVAVEILSHGNESSGKMIFSEVMDDRFTRILASPLRTSGAILSALTRYAETDPGKRLIDDIPFKLVRFITQARKKKDHWENTQANIFCMKGLIDYAGRYEDKRPDFTVRADFDQVIMGQARFVHMQDKAKVFKRPIQEGDPGRTATIHLERNGQGRLYYATRLSYAPLGEGKKSVNAGIEIHREYSLIKDNQWRLLKNPMKLERGDLVRVDLFLSLPATRNFVVVDDPVPGGLEPVNRDLATASTVDADEIAYKAAEGSWWFRHTDWSSYGISRWSFYHSELRHNTARFYSEYLPAGNYHLSYTAQVIAPGEFTVLPVRAEEMYDPDVYGHGVQNLLMVDPASRK
jgi:alpha-2-macroglobulin